jgi:hypothetical protein
MALFAAGNPLDEHLARERLRHQRYLAFLDDLRAGDPDFAAASVRHPRDHVRWQGSVYLLSGVRPLWGILGPSVVEAGSLTPVAEALARPGAPRDAIECTLMAWAVHLSNEGQPPPGFPERLSVCYFRRWVSALHLRHGSALADE